MKRSMYLFGLILILYGLTFDYKPLFAQLPWEPKPPCKPDCDSSNFGPDQFFEFNLPNGCRVRVRYNIRKACGVWDDVYIGEIYFVNPDTIPCRDLIWDPYPTTVRDKKTVINFVTQQFLLLNPMNFAPLTSNDPCNSNWRVMRGACWTAWWRSDLVQPGMQWPIAYVPCTTVDCCLEHYTVCIDPVTKARVVTKTSSGPQPTCTPTDGYTCEPICE